MTPGSRDRASGARLLLARQRAPPLCVRLDLSGAITDAPQSRGGANTLAAAWGAPASITSHPTAGFFCSSHKGKFANRSHVIEPSAPHAAASVFAPPRLPRRFQFAIRHGQTRAMNGYRRVIRRRLFNFAAAVSMLLFVITIALWVRTQFAFDWRSFTFRFGPQERGQEIELQIESDRSGLGVYFYSRVYDDPNKIFAWDSGFSSKGELGWAPDDGLSSFLRDESSAWESSAHGLRTPSRRRLRRRPYCLIGRC